MEASDERVDFRSLRNRRRNSLMGNARMPEPTTALDHESTIVAVVELSARSWLVGAQVAGVPRQCRQKLVPSAEGLLDHLDHLRQRAEKAAKRVSRVVVAYEAGRDGFWLARWLLGRGIEVYVIQPSSVPVDRRARRAKTDALDVEMLLRTTLAWLRGEPRVCSMVPIPSEVEEDGRRPLRERQDLIKARLALTNKIDGVLATLGVGGYRPLRGDRRERLEALRRPGGGPLPAHAKARLTRLLDRLELVLQQIKVLEEARDAVVARDAVPRGEADSLVRRLAGVKGIGPELATLLAWEAFVRPFRDRRALAAYAGLTGTPFDSGDKRREQGIGKAGNRRLRAALVELAWLWLRYQPQSALAAWFRSRTGSVGGRMRKVMIVALARKLLVALWRFCRDGVLPEGAVLKAT
jgi:transposase